MSDDPAGSGDHRSGPSRHPAMTPLDPAAYAPYADPEDFILSRTDRIWMARGMGQIREHYAEDIAVHGANGTITGNESIIAACLQKNAAFPQRAFTGEDVIWEARGPASFLSSHRILNAGRQTGWWQYGPPTFRHSCSRNIAITLVSDARVVEEWVVRDEWAVVEQSGHDVAEVASQLATQPPRELVGDSGLSALGQPPPDPLRGGVSGPRPESGREEDQLAVAMMEDVWGRHLGQTFAQYFDRDIIVDTSRHLTFAREDGYKDTLDLLFGPFPDASVAIYDVAFNEDAFHGTRVSLLWVLRGTYCGTPLYGPLTRSPVEILGASHFLFRRGKIIREWRVFDELALLTQIVRDRY